MAAAGDRAICNQNEDDKMGTQAWTENKAALWSASIKTAPWFIGCTYDKKIDILAKNELCVHGKHKEMSTYSYMDISLFFQSYIQILPCKKRSGDPNITTKELGT